VNFFLASLPPCPRGLKGQELFKAAKKAWSDQKMMSEIDGQGKDFFLRYKFGDKPKNVGQNRVKS